MLINSELAKKIKIAIQQGQRIDFIVKNGSLQWDVVVEKQHPWECMIPQVYVNGIDQFKLFNTHSWFSIPWRDRPYDKSWRWLLSLDKTHTEIEYVETDSILLIHPKEEELMPQLSEKAVVSTTGEIKVKGPKKVGHYNAKGTPRINRYVKPIHTPSDKVYQQKKVCLKHTNGIIGRFTIETSKELLSANPDTYTYCSKQEWKHQVLNNDNKKEPIVGNPTFKRESLKLEKEKSITSFRKDNKIAYSNKQIIETIVPQQTYTKKEFYTEYIKEKYMATVVNPKHRSDPSASKTILKERIKITPIRKERDVTVIIPEHTKIKVILQSCVPSIKVKQNTRKKVSHKLAVLSFYTKNTDEAPNKVFYQKKAVGKETNQWHDKYAEIWKKTNPDGKVTMHYREDNSTKKDKEIIQNITTTLEERRKRILPTSTKIKTWKFTPKKKGVK